MMPRAERRTTAWERVAPRTARHPDRRVWPSRALSADGDHRDRNQIDQPGPALFKQRRVGLARRLFCFYKFRTMRLGGDDSALREMIGCELRGEDTSSRRLEA